MKERRYICLDTETTGLSVSDDHKIIEIGCVEVIDNQIKSEFHSYINPCRNIDKGSTEIHGITNEFVQDKPLFKDISDEFLSFLSGDDKYENIIVAHNARFDLSFVNNELQLIDSPNLNQYKVVDTLKVAKILFPGQKASLDALCKRFSIDNIEREQKGHSAILDARLLARLFIEMLKYAPNEDPIDMDTTKMEKYPIEKVGYLEPRNLSIVHPEELSEHERIISSWC